MRTLIALVVLALLLVVGVGAIDAATYESGDVQTVTNETFTPSNASYTALNESNRADVTYATSGDLVVYDENDTRVSESAYEWNRTDGTIKAVSGGELDNDANASVTYSYSITTQTQREFRALFTSLIDGAGAFLIILAVAALLGAMRSFS